MRSGGEDRIAPRRRVLKAASIEVGGGAFDCTVRNLSDAGYAAFYRRALHALFRQVELLSRLDQAPRETRPRTPGGCTTSSHISSQRSPRLSNECRSHFDQVQTPEGQPLSIQFRTS